MAMDKMERARREGMSYALRIAHEKGVKGLEEELKWRNATNVPLTIPKSKLNECIDNIKKNTVDTVVILSAITLRDEYGFGHDRLLRFIKRFYEKAECISGEYCTWDDNIQVLAEECGIELGIRHNDTNVII